MVLSGKKHSIGKTIATLRKEKGWTQVELAEKLQVSDKAVSKWEKDDSSPSVEFFPALAELFGVSIDYLMTGKTAEKEIIAMSKIELCAKEDNVQLFETLNDEILKRQDENNKTILDYMLRYNCKTVVQAFFKRYPASTILAQNGYRAGCPYWYTENVMKLLICNNMVKELESIGAFDLKANSRNRDSEADIHRYRDLILKNGVSEEIQTRYFHLLNARDIAECFSTLLDSNSKKQIEALWSIVKKLNEENITKKENAEKEYAGRYMYNIQYSNVPCNEYEAIGTSCNYSYYVVAFPVELIEKFLDKGFTDIASQANAFNAKLGAPVLNGEKFAYVKAKESGKATKKDLAVLKLTVNGVINIDELLKTKDFPFIKTTLLNNPIHIIERLYTALQNKEWRTLFEFAIDNNLPASGIIKCDTKETEITLLIFWNSSAANSCINKSLMYVEENGRRYNLLAWHYGEREFKPNSIEDLITKIQLCKQQILNEYCWQLDKEKTIGDLTREYFEKELAKGNTEMVIIKLCVRLEAILRSDYHYEGDFSDMLNRFCSFFNTTDDERNDYDPHTPRILNKLRMQRNGIVHSEKCNEELSMEELKFCIDYICKMG